MKLLLGKPRPAFLSPFTVAGHGRRLCRSKGTCTMKKRMVVTCVAAKLLVIELDELILGGGDLNAFSERVEVDRKNSKDTTFVVYCKDGGYKGAMDMVDESGVVEADAVVTYNGAELYQKGYRTPDPYWSTTVVKNWDAKPTKWVVEKYFGEELEFKRGGDGKLLEIGFERKGEKLESEEVGICERIEGKLKEMGITARVGEKEGEVVILPVGAEVGNVVAFCQKMLRIGEGETFVFGKKEWVQGVLSGNSNWGIVGGEDEAGERIFVSDRKGVDALVDGVLHFAVF